MDERIESSEQNNEIRKADLKSDAGTNISEAKKESYTDEYDNYCPWEL